LVIYNSMPLPSTSSRFHAAPIDFHLLLLHRTHKDPAAVYVSSMHLTFRLLNSWFTAFSGTATIETPHHVFNKIRI
jgi:hypothetical protein